MSEHAATDYDNWFHQYGDTERECDEAEHAAFMAAVEEVYRDTLIHVGRVEEHSRHIQELAVCRCGHAKSRHVWGPHSDEQMPRWFCKDYGCVCGCFEAVRQVSPA